MRSLLLVMALLALASAPMVTVPADDEPGEGGPNPYEPCIRIDTAGGGWYLHPPGCVPDPDP